MEVNERNANALNAEQIRQRDIINKLVERVTKLEADNAALRNELQAFKAMVLPRIMGNGATS
jgi:hypothetical protein